MKDRKLEIAESAARFAEVKIMNDLAQDVNIYGHELLEGSTEEAYLLSTMHMGPVAPMFKKVEVTIKVSLDSNEAGTWVGIYYKYSYDHVHGGSNGYRVEAVYEWTSVGEWRKYR